MGGERLAHATIGPLGIDGDRIVHVENAGGRVMSSRTHPRLLGHHASTSPRGVPMVDGLEWTDPRVAVTLAVDVSPGARLVRDDSSKRFDVLPLLVATDGAIAAFGYDGRRLRPNLVIGGVAGLDERTWQGRTLRIGAVVIDLADLRARCVMTTFDPDTLVQNPRVLQDIVRRFDGTLALNARVVHGGTVSEGDEVSILSA